MRVLPQSAQSRPIPPQTHPQYRYPSERHLLPSRCGHCTARLVLGDIPTADAPVADVSCLYCARVCAELIHDGMRRPMTPEEWRALPAEQPKRGRTVKTAPAPRYHGSCADCGAGVSRFDATRCASCAGKRKAEDGLQGQLIVLLRDGPMRAGSLAQAMAISADSLRGVIKRARARGHRIVQSTWGQYALEGRR